MNCPMCVQLAKALVDLTESAVYTNGINDDLGEATSIDEDEIYAAQKALDAYTLSLSVQPVPVEL